MLVGKPLMRWFLHTYSSHGNIEQNGQARANMKGFDKRWKDLPDYILGITKEIWEDRNVHTLHGYYGKNMPKRSGDGIVVGASNVIAETLELGLGLVDFPG